MWCFVTVVIAWALLMAGMIADMIERDYRDDEEEWDDEE